MDISPTILFLIVVGLIAALTISIRWPFAFTVIIIIINERFFGFFPFLFRDYDLVRAGVGPLLLFLAIIIQVVFRQTHFRNGLHAGGGSYLPVCLAVIGIVAFSSLWGGVFIYKQSLRSMIFQPVVFSYYFLYIYLCFFSPDKKQIMRFLGVVVFVALSVSVLMALNAYFFHEARLFKYANISDRVGFVRIVLFVTGLVWAYYYSLASADEERYPLSRQFLFGLSALFLLFTIVFILLGRQIMLSCVLTTAVVALSMKIWKKLLIAWAMALFLLISIANPDFSFEKSSVGKLVNLTSAEAKTKESTIGIRLKAIEYYYEYFKNTYGLGFGVLGSRREYRNPVSQGLTQGYNLNDLSLAGIIFRFGIPGLFLIIITAWKLFKDTGKILKTHDPFIRSITRGIRYTILHSVIIFPLTTFLFYQEQAVFFAIMFFIVERLRNIVHMETAEEAA
jgi:hypothetical protein